MKTILHKAESRGFFDHGWLKTHHTFSFADYYNPVVISGHCAYLMTTG